MPARSSASACATRKPAVLCSHGPVLPEILTEIALATGTLRGSYLGSASALEAGRVLGRAPLDRQPRFRDRRDRNARAEDLTRSG